MTDPSNGQPLKVGNIAEVRTRVEEIDYSLFQILCVLCILLDTFLAYECILPSLTVNFLRLSRQTVILSKTPYWMVASSEESVGQI